MGKQGSNHRGEAAGRRGPVSPLGRQQRTIAVLAACDRFNFGDLLFPFIIKEFLAQPYDCQARTFAIEQSNLSRMGAVPTEALSSLLARGTLQDGDVVVVGGGALIGAPWRSLHHDLVGTRDRLFGRLVRLLVGDAYYERLLARRYGVNHVHAFAVARHDFPARVRVVYNSVGAIGLRACEAQTRAKIAAQLNEADYLSVRDTVSRVVLTEAGVTREIAVAPDSAVLIADIYPKSEVRKRSSPTVGAIQEKYGRGYLALQCFNGIDAAVAGVIAREAEQIFHTTGLPCVLISLGRVHGDDVTVKKLARLISTPRIVVPRSSILEILGLIAGAAVFAGTSLHGNLTAVTYAVPQVALGGRPKLEAFLETWDIASGPTVAWNALSAAIGRALKAPPDALVGKSVHLRELARINCSRLAEAAGLGRSPA